ncbi:MarR family transcriptional regulator [Rhodanobacter umsongensis]|uniref:MarR family transcriptional regulator n=1 Tax=Rhodanobacter umsongensis TaxID=633153 RepID=A0ABW0JR96_9GAMM
MQASTEVLERLMGSALRAITQPQSKQVDMAIEQARAAAQEASVAVHRHGRGVHQPSFDLGVTTTIVRLLDTTTQDRWLSDLRAVARAIPHGLQTLQEIARLNALGSQPTQQELADRLRVDRGNFNRHIRKLTDLGLIESSRRRQALLYALTALGEEVAQARPIQEPTLSEALRASASPYAEIAQRQRRPFAGYTGSSTADAGIAASGRAFEWAAPQATPPARFERGSVVKFDTQLLGTPA